MKRTRSWLLLALPCVLAACASEAEDATVAEGGDTVSATMMDTAGAAAMPMAVALQAVGGSTASGQATLTPAGGQTQLSVQLSGVSPGEHAGHIHQGTCEALGAVVQPLPSITAAEDGTGAADTTVAFDAHALADGQHVLNYHGTAEDPGAPVACGVLASHMM